MEETFELPRRIFVDRAEDVAPSPELSEWRVPLLDEDNREIGAVLWPVQAEAEALAALLAAAPRMLRVLQAVGYFKQKGVTKQSVWTFVAADADHPAWYAFLTEGSPGVMRWLDIERDTVIADALRPSTTGGA